MGANVAYVVKTIEFKADGKRTFDYHFVSALTCQDAEQQVRDMGYNVFDSAPEDAWRSEEWD